MSAVSVVIPAYRSELSIRQLYESLVPVLEAHCQAFEIIFVEDCGGDNTWVIICELAAADSRVRGIQLNRNYGQHNALLCGIRAADHEVIVTMDDDLQHPPSEIPSLLKALDQGWDVVYGAPNVEQHGILRNVASRLTKIALAGIMGADTARNVSAFRAFRTRLRDGFSFFRSPDVSIDVLLTWTTTRFTAVHVRHETRTFGKSGYTARKLVRHAFNLATGFSVVPLQIASIVGFIFVLLGGLVLAYVGGNYLIHGAEVQGFTFLACIVTIFSGAQLFALGVFGEYLARIHFRSMERPAYLIRQTADQSALRSVETSAPDIR